MLEATSHAFIHCIPHCIPLTPNPFKKKQDYRQTKRLRRHVSGTTSSFILPFQSPYCLNNTTSRVSFSSLSIKYSGRLCEKQRILFRYAALSRSLYKNLHRPSPTFFILLLSFFLFSAHNGHPRPSLIFHHSSISVFHRPHGVFFLDSWIPGSVRRLYTPPTLYVHPPHILTVVHPMRRSYTFLHTRLKKKTRRHNKSARW
jgi:hypothetical protein